MVTDQARTEVTRSGKKFESPCLVELRTIGTQTLSWSLENLRLGFLITGREVEMEVTLQPFSLWGGDQAGRNDYVLS